MSVTYSSRTLGIAAFLALVPVVAFAMLATSQRDVNHFGNSVRVSISSKPQCPETIYPKSVQTVLSHYVDGRYAADACVDGRGQHVLVDPRIEGVILKWDDAVELDLKPNHLSYDQRIKFRGDVVKVAPVRLRSIRIGSVEVTDVPAFVARYDDVRTTLVGRAFLDRLRQHGQDDRGRYVMLAR